MLQWNALRTAAAAAVVLAGACGPEVNSGAGVACRGKQTRCTLPSAKRLPLPEQLTELATLALPNLEPTWARPVEPAPDAMLRPIMADGSLWVVPKYAEPPYRLHQLDMNGELLSSYVLEGPAGSSSRTGEYAFQEFSSASGSAGPVLGATWDSQCKGEQQPPCQQLEVLTFHDRAERGPERFLIDSPLSWDTSLTAAQVPGSTDLLVLHSGFDLALQRFDARGRLVWQQGALGQGLAGSIFSTPIGFGKSGSVLLAGLSAEESAYLRLVALRQIDEHGNVTSQHLVGPFPEKLVSQLSVASSSTGKISLGTSDTNGTVRILRFTEQLEALDGVLLRGALSVTLAADGRGDVVARTVSAGLFGAYAILCKLPAEGEPACFAAPALDSAIAVADDGAVFGLDRDQRLLRYDLP